MQACNSTGARRKRAAEPYGSQATESAMVSVGPLYTEALGESVTYSIHNEPALSFSYRA